MTAIQGLAKNEFEKENKEIHKQGRNTALCTCLESFALLQRYTYRVLQTIQMKLILLCVWAEPAVLGSTQTTLKFKYEN